MWEKKMGRVLMKKKWIKTIKNWENGGVGKRGPRGLRRRLSGAGGENEGNEAHGCLKTDHVAFWAMSIDRL
jgi:hypothetical protein